MKRRNIYKAVLVFIFFIITAYAGLWIWFKSDIDRICQNAMKQYEGDKIEALLSVLNSEHQTFDIKNEAIWALGKLRDKRSLSVLKRLRTGTACDHHRFVCQRGVERSIAVLEGRKLDILTFK